jgi:hypothetical protein
VKLNPEFPWQKQHSTGIKPTFKSKPELNISKKLVKCYMWTAGLCGAET